MRILVDLQGAQSHGSRRRGIGRYSYSLTRALARRGGEHEFVVLLNAAFQESADELRQDLTDHFPHVEVRFWTAPEGCGYAQPSSEARFRRVAAEYTREAVIADIDPDFVLITSLFEGYGEEIVTTVSRFAAHNTAVILYDLIPYQFSDHYLANAVTREWYQNKLEHLRRADVILTISDATRQDAAGLIDLSCSTLTNISTAVDTDFYRHLGSDDEWSDLKTQFSVRDDFVLYTGGIDFRKNLERLLTGFALFKTTSRSTAQLVVVCSLLTSERDHYLQIAIRTGLTVSDIIFTGYVEHHSLLILYSRCSLFIFPSFAEGFGLPVLEAMKCGAVVLGSRVSSIPEVIDFPEALFDPYDVSDIASRIEYGLLNENFRERFITHAVEQVKKFSWDHTADRLIEALASWSSQETPPKTPSWNKKTLAYVSPLPPDRSGIAQYTAELLPSLLLFYDITIISDGIDTSDWWAPLDIPVRSPRWLRENAGRFDRVVYHFGNSEFHSYMFELLATVPGAVVLHDFFLSGILNYIDTGDSDEKFSSALYASHGYGALVTKKNSLWTAVEEYPANFPVLTHALGTIVHSNGARELAATHYGSNVAKSLHVAPLAQGKARLIDRTLARSKLGLRQDEVLFCSFGMVHKRKQSEEIVRAWRTFLRLADSRTASRPRLVLVGAADNAYERQIRELAGDAFAVTGWVSDGDYATYLSAADVAIQMRSENRGESSRSVLECLAAGLPTIVGAVGSFRELPDDAVLKVAPDDIADRLPSAMLEIFGDPTLRSNLADAAREYVSSTHLPSRVAERYEQCIEAIYGGSVAVMNTAWQASVDRCTPAQVSSISDVAEALGQLHCRPAWRRRRLLMVAADDWEGLQGYRRDILQPGPVLTEPVYCDGAGVLRYARRLTCKALGIEAPHLVDEVLDYRYGDTLVSAVHQHLAASLRRKLLLAGVAIEPA